jgi:hypothetical protein
VSLLHTKVTFKDSGDGEHGISNADLLDLAGPGIERGLMWKIAQIDDGAIRQVKAGNVIGCAMMGDGDANRVSSAQDDTACSIVRVRQGVYQLVNIGNWAADNDPDVPMVVVRTDDNGVRYTDLMEQAEGIYEPDPIDTDYYIDLGPHPPDVVTVDDVGNRSWSYWDDGAGREDDNPPKGFKLWTYVYAYRPAEDYPDVIQFYRVTYHDSHGRVQKVTIEELVATEWTTPI